MLRKLPANHSAVIAIFENVWEREFRNVAERYGGRVINQQLMSSQDVAKAGRRSELINDH